MARKESDTKFHGLRARITRKSVGVVGRDPAACIFDVFVFREIRVEFFRYDERNRDLRGEKRVSSRARITFGVVIG